MFVAGPSGEIAAPPPRIQVSLSTASVFPGSTADAFEVAARLGYDGVELMVAPDPVSQDVDAVRRLSDYHQVPVLSVHAPCLLLTQRVWGTDPWAKLERAREAADALGCSTVVVHPPFRWQRDYAKAFVEGIERMAGETDVRFAVENMFPLRARGHEVVPYAPSWSPLDEDYRHVTLDLSHTSVSQTDAMDLTRSLGDRLVHVHLADGLGSARDEHLIPGRGQQPCAELLQHVAGNGFDGHIVVEVSTRTSDQQTREADLGEALAFTRSHLAQGAARSVTLDAPAPARAGAGEF